MPIYLRICQNESFRAERAVLREQCISKASYTDPDSRDIITAATKCLDVIWRDGHRYQKAGVMLGDFYSQGVAQLNLFDDNAPRKNSEKLMEVLDHLNAKDGRGTLYFAGQGIQTASADETRNAIPALYYEVL